MIEKICLENGSYYTENGNVYENDLSKDGLHLQNSGKKLFSQTFIVCRPWQYDTICWKLNLISGFFVFFWLFVWADGINKCGWCLAGGRGC